MDFSCGVSLIALGIVGGIPLLLVLSCLGEDAVQKLRIYIAIREHYAINPDDSGGVVEG